MAMNKMFLRLAMTLVVMLLAACSPQSADATPTYLTLQEPVNVTCASEGYTGTQLTWCKNICENGLTGQVLDTWIHRWKLRYRALPYCAVVE